MGWTILYTHILGETREVYGVYGTYVTGETRKVHIIFKVRGTSEACGLFEVVGLYEVGEIQEAEVCWIFRIGVYRTCKWVSDGQFLLGVLALKSAVFTASLAYILMLSQHTNLSKILRLTK